MFTTILWDNDGVLVDTERLYYESTREILAGLDIDLTLELHHQLSFADNKGIWPLLADRGYGESIIQALRTARNRRYLELIETSEIEVPGARFVLESLYGKIHMAMVTSSLKDALNTTHAKTGFLDLMDFVIANGDYERSKPDPEPYLTAIARSGADPDTIVVVEDSQRGLVAAKAAGLACWVIPSSLTAAGDFSTADATLDSIEEIPHRLEAINGPL